MLITNDHSNPDNDFVNISTSHSDYISESYLSSILDTLQRIDPISMNLLYIVIFVITTLICFPVVFLIPSGGLVYAIRFGTISGFV